MLSVACEQELQDPQDSEMEQIYSSPILTVQLPLTVLELRLPNISTICLCF